MFEDTWAKFEANLNSTEERISIALKDSNKITLILHLG